MALLWTLLTTQTIMAIGSNQKSYHPVGNCESQILYFQVLKLELRSTKITPCQSEENYLSL